MSAPVRSFVRFALANTVIESSLPPETRRARYRVDAVHPRGAAPMNAELAAGAELVRLETEASSVVAAGGLVGVTQHVVYTDALARSELAAISAPPHGELAVLIPIRKSAAWWALAQDERLARFHGRPGAPGHHAIGAAYTTHIFRKLYHARYLPGSDWDFLTYFEFSHEQSGAFRELLGELRDTRKNPEWELVESELEIWMTKR